MGNNIKDFFFDGNIYANINMSQGNGIIPLKLNIIANQNLPPLVACTETNLDLPLLQSTDLPTPLQVG
jgi:hypothetical protein